MGEQLPVQKYSDVKSKKISWLWYPYIAYGKITLLQGDPGDGKSTFVLHLIALLTKGAALPDGTQPKGPISAIYQCNEDDPADTIKPRLISAGADCDRVMFFGSNMELTLNDQRLEASIKESGARLVVFDPIQAFLPEDIDMTNAVRMRTIMKKLGDVAARRKCAILLVGHMNKAGTGKELYRLLGSIDIAATARSILMLSRDETDPDLRCVKQIKNNLAYAGPTLTFRLSQNGFEWGEIQTNDAPAAEAAGKVKPIDKAKKAIETILLEGDAKGKDVLEHLDLMDISERTARRAMQEMNVRTYRKKNAWYWSLPVGEEKSNEDK